ncbi:MAG: cupin domain-containing protein [Candidatus Humimicrobiaceae bacterium]
MNDKLTRLLSVIIVSIFALTMLTGCAQETSEVGKIITVDYVSDVATATISDAPMFADVEGQKGWSVSLISDARVGVDYYIFKIKKGADIYPIHSAPGTWLAYVAEGSGEIVLADKQKVEKSTESYKKGDYIILGPDVLHGWKNGSTDTTLIFVTLKAVE